MPAQLKITGAADLERALKDLGGQIAGRLGENAVRAGARVIVNAAKQKAPYRTGFLRDSIRVFRAPTQPKGERTAYVGSRAPYAAIVEFGTVHISPRGFLRAGLDESAQAALNKLTENLGRGIERETAKYKGKR